MSVFRLEGWVVDPSRNRIVRGRLERTLQPRQMDVLVCLIEAGGEVVSKARLLQDVWDGRFVVEHVVPKTVSGLRQALEESAREACVIETVPRRGYRIACAIEQLEDAPVPIVAVAAHRSRRPVALRWSAAVSLAGALAGLLVGGPVASPGSQFMTHAVVKRPMGLARERFAYKLEPAVRVDVGLALEKDVDVAADGS